MSHITSPSHSQPDVEPSNSDSLPDLVPNAIWSVVVNWDVETIMLPQDLQSIRFGDDFNELLDNVTLPEALYSISFGREFNQSMEHVRLPSGVEIITFGRDFNQSMESVTLPSALRIWTA